MHFKGTRKVAKKINVGNESSENKTSFFFHLFLVNAVSILAKVAKKKAFATNKNSKSKKKKSRGGGLSTMVAGNLNSTFINKFLTLLESLIFNLNNFIEDHKFWLK